MAANNRGEADVREINGIVKACNTCFETMTKENPAKPNFYVCAANQCKRQAVQDRALSCNNPTWLPF